MISVRRAPAHLTVQDLGRPGHRASGMPAGGAMDAISLCLGNALLGNDRSAAALEWAVSGGAIRFHTEARFVLTGAVVAAALGGTSAVANVVHRARAGDVLEVERIVRGRFLYVCVAGGIDVAPVLGARATYVPAALGGLGGRRLAAGDQLPLGERRGLRGDVDRTDAGGMIGSFDVLADGSPIRIVLSAQENAVPAAQLAAAELRLSAQSDRTGYRLEGVRFASGGDAAALSQPACAGVIQLPPAGTPIVLMADAPTLGGYPRIAVVASADLGRLAQRMPGDIVKFRATGVHAARKAALDWRRDLERISALTRMQIET